MSADLPEPGEAALNAIRKNPKDEQAWTDFYDYFRRQVAGALFVRGVRQDLVDITQEVFSRFLEASPWKDDWATLPPRAVVTAYLRRTAIRLAVDQFRKEKRRGEQIPVELDELAAESTAIEEILDNRDRFDRVMNRLSAEDRGLLGLLLNGASLGTIAFELGLSYNAAGVRVHRLKRRVSGLDRSAD